MGLSANGRRTGKNSRRALMLSVTDRWRSAPTLRQRPLSASCEILQQKSLRICDANLREPFYSDRNTLRRSFQFADVLKLNEKELFQVSSLFELGGGDEIELTKKLLREFDLDLICVTKGSRGSLLVSEKQTIEHHGINVEVADAIGAGDAFTACVAHYFIQGRPLERDQ